MKKVKHLLMLLAILTTSICVSSCNKDEDESVENSIQDYYLEIDVTGGGYDAAKLNEFKATLNTTLAPYKDYLEGLKKDEAIYEFDKIMKEFKNSFSEGIKGINGTLKLIFYLKTNNGNTVKKSVLSVTKDGCTLN